jgi:hypothetical protein
MKIRQDGCLPLTECQAGKTLASLRNRLSVPRFFDLITGDHAILDQQR